MSPDPLLTHLLAGIIGLAVACYVLLDGFDLGVGILLPLFPADQRDTLMGAIEPVWDANETWLVLGGTLLLAAFPRAYGSLLPLLYLPLTAMLVALILRGVLFELREHLLPVWAWPGAFCAASLMAGFCQGLILGAFVTGPGDGGPPWLGPFPLAIGLAVVLAYALIGACWLVYRSPGPVQARARRLAQGLTWAAAASILLVSLWTPLMEARIAERWFSLPHLLGLAPLPLSAAGLWLLLRHYLDRGNRPLVPWLACVALYLTALAGLGISMWPYVIPTELTLAEAAAAAATQELLAWAVLICLPVVLGATGWVYYTFRRPPASDPPDASGASD